MGVLTDMVTKAHVWIQTVKIRSGKLEYRREKSKISKFWPRKYNRNYSEQAYIRCPAPGLGQILFLIISKT